MVLVCPGCGAGLATRRGLRLHLLSHGFDAIGAHAVAAEVVRTKAPTVWKCKTCRRRFSSVRGLCLHARVTGHGTVLDIARIRGSPSAPA